MTRSVSSREDQDLRGAVSLRPMVPHAPFTNLHSKEGFRRDTDSGVPPSVSLRMKLALLNAGWYETDWVYEKVVGKQAEKKTTHKQKTEKCPSLLPP